MKIIYHIPSFILLQHIRALYHKHHTPRNHRLLFPLGNTFYHPITLPDIAKGNDWNEEYQLTSNYILLQVFPGYTHSRRSLVTMNPGLWSSFELKFNCIRKSNCFLHAFWQDSVWNDTSWGHIFKATCLKKWNSLPLLQVMILKDEKSQLLLAAHWHNHISTLNSS